MSGTRLTEDNYAAFLCSIYSTYQSADEEKRKRLREAIKDRTGDLYYRSSPHSKVNTIFLPEFDSDKWTITHAAFEYGGGIGSFEFSAQKAVIKTIHRAEATANCHRIFTIENNTITFETFRDDKKNNEPLIKKDAAALAELESFFYSCELHTIKELVEPFLKNPRMQASVENKSLADPSTSSPSPSLYPAIEPTVPQYQPYRPFQLTTVSQQDNQYQPYQPAPQQYAQYQHLPIQQSVVQSEEEKPVYSSKRYDNVTTKPLSQDEETAKRRKYQSPKEIENSDYFNTGKRNTEKYTRYAGVNCLALEEAKTKPKLSWLDSWRGKKIAYTKVEIHQGELGLITHNGEKEIIGPGIYYFSKSTTLDTNKGENGKIKANAPLIEHGERKILTVPRGHLQRGSLEEEKHAKSYVLMTPGRYNLDKNTDKVSSVVNPYGLEMSVKGEPPFELTTPTGKNAYSHLVYSEEIIQIYPAGKKEIDTTEEIFDGRLSTKIQTFKLEKILVVLQDNVTATVDATVSYQIPDDAVESEQKGIPSSIQKIVLFPGGRTEDDIIKKKIEGEGGLAQSAVKAECKKINRNQLLENNKITITKPDTDLNVHENPTYAGVKFLSVSFNTISFDQKEADKLSESAIEKIETIITQLDDKASDEYKTLRTGVESDLGFSSKAEVKSSVPTPSSRYKPKDINGEADRDTKAADPLPSQKRILYPENSANYFNGDIREGKNYVPYSSKHSTLSCASQSYLNTYARWFDWLFLPDWITGNKSIEIQKGEIGLIRINNKPEFLKPGKYSLPPSIEWVRKEKIEPSIEGTIVVIQHDSITVANIPEKQALYVEDNTLLETDGSVKEYRYLGEGTHLIDSPTMTHREFVPCNNALIVKRSDDEKARIQEREWKLILGSPAASIMPKKRELYLQDDAGFISCIIQDGGGRYAQRTLKITSPQPFELATLRNLEIQILQELASNKLIQYTSEQDSSNKVLAVRIDQTEAGVFYNEKGDVCICGPGEFELKDEWTFYSRIKLEGKKEITVEAYTADNIRVRVKATVDYQLPIQQLAQAVETYGPNKIVNEIERLATEAVVRQVRLWDYSSSAAKITYTDVQGVQASFSNQTKEEAQKTIRADISNFVRHGIAITNVTLVDQIEPTDPRVKSAMLKMLAKKAEIREAIKDECGHQSASKTQKTENHHHGVAPMRSNDSVSAAALPFQSMYASTPSTQQNTASASPGPHHQQPSHGFQ